MALVKLFGLMNEKDTVANFIFGIPLIPSQPVNQNEGTDEEEEQKINRRATTTVNVSVCVETLVAC